MFKDKLTFSPVLRVLLVMLGCCLVIGGSAQQRQRDILYTIRYWNGDTLLMQERLSPQEFPHTFTPETESGLRFLGWDRAAVPAAGDMDFHAIFAPILNRHMPYLFSREDGFLHPDDPFTPDDLRSALNALASEDAQSHFPELPEGNTLTVGQLKEVMSVFYPMSYRRAFAGYEDKTPLTRAMAAKILNTLLGRAEETVSLGQYTVDYADNLPTRPDRADLLEAAISHTHGDTHWEDVTLVTLHEPGWELKKGILRHYDDNGYLYTDTELPGGFTMDAQGRYTSGSPALDKYVTELLAQLQEETPKASREELLRGAFNYVRDSFTYLRKPAREMGETGFEVEDALVMFKTGMGNCYNYASAFWACARNLGYDAKCIAGAIGGARDKGLYPHSWVKIEFDGKMYIFDTELEMAKRKEKGSYRSMFKLTLAEASSWRYTEKWVPPTEDAK